MVLDGRKSEPPLFSLLPQEEVEERGVMVECRCR